MSDMTKKGTSNAVRISVPAKTQCYRLDDGNAVTGVLFNQKMARNSLVKASYVVAVKPTADGSSNYKINVGHHATINTLAKDIISEQSASGLTVSIIGVEVVVAEGEYITARLTATDGTTAAVAAGMHAFMWVTITPIPTE
jgi:hypothetical protein